MSDRTDLVPSIPTVETERLVLRAIRDDDLDDYTAIFGDAETVRYLGGGTPATREDAWRNMAMVLGHWHLRGYGLWAAEERDTGRVIGRIGLYNPEGWPGLEVGWAVLRDRWGKGYAPEAGGAALRYAFTVLDADHVISVIHPDNVASRRVAEKLGGTVEREIADFRDSGPVVIYGYDRPPVPAGPSD